MANPVGLDRKGAGLAHAIECAMANAGVTPADIDHVQCHGVSLEMYDQCETNAYKKALGERAYRIPISAIKSLTGQPYAAGGTMGLAAALMAFKTGTVPPTLNLEDPDPECDLDYVPGKSRVNDVETALVASMSFGGTHSAVILRRAN